MEKRQKDDMEKIRKEKYDYSRLIKYYKRKLVDYDAMREISGVKSQGTYLSKIKAKDILQKVNLTA